MGMLLHLVTDAELVFVGLTSKCEKRSQHKWVGSRGGGGGSNSYWGSGARR